MKSRCLVSIISTTVALTALTSIASAATTSALLYSVDGGTTWSSSASANPGQTILVREWYNNPDSTSYSGESLTISLPAGFARVPNSTKVCTSPLTTNSQTPVATEDKCANQTDSLVWSGSSLTASPTSGLYGQTVATSGIMNLGQKAYLNLHQCMYQYTTTVAGSPDQDRYASAVNSLPAGATQFNAGTNASNAADSSATCGSGDASYVPLANQTSFQAISLVGNRYLNLNECTYARNQASPLYEEFQTLINGQQDANFRASTHASNTADASATCTSGDATYQSSSNGTQALDLLGNRYFNLNQCAYRYTATAPFAGHLDTAANWPKNGSPNPPFSTGSNTSNTPDAAPTCGAGNSTYAPLSGSTANQAIDLYDGARGAGFVQFSVTVPSPSSTTSYPQNASVIGPSTSSSNGTVTVVVATADAAHSGVAVTTNNAVANGAAIDTLSAYTADAGGNPVANQVVTFTQPSGVTLSSTTCTTNASGLCQVTATSTAAASYSSTVTIGGTSLSGSITVGGVAYGPSPANYTFVAGAADATHSGVAVTANNAIANGTATDTLQTLIRDAQGNPIAGQVVTFTQPSGVTLSSTTCTTNVSGICQVTATSTTAASYSSTITIGGTSLSGSVTVGGTTYGPSPANYVFAMNGPVLPTCTANPNPASASQQVTITCTVGTPGDTVTIPGTNCASAIVPAGGTVVCTGTGSDIGNNPTITVSNPTTGARTASVSLTVTRSGATSAVPAPALGTCVLILLAMLMAASTYSSRFGSRTTDP